MTDSFIKNGVNYRPYSDGSGYVRHIDASLKAGVSPDPDSFAKAMAEARARRLASQPERKAGLLALLLGVFK